MDYIVRLFIAHTRKNREREAPAIFLFSLRIIPLPVAKLLLIIRLKMKRDEVHTGTNSSTLKFFDEMIAPNSQSFQMQTQYIQMPRTFSIRQNLRNLQRIQLGKSLVIAFCDAPSITIRSEERRVGKEC